MRLLAGRLTCGTGAWFPLTVPIHIHQIVPAPRSCALFSVGRELRMNAKSCLQRTKEGRPSRSTGSRRPFPPDACRRSRESSANSAIDRRGAGRRGSYGLSSVIDDVVAGFMDSLRSTGEGALPLVLAIRPKLSMQGVGEADCESVGRESLQSAAKSRFFKAIEPALRGALTRVLTVATRDLRPRVGERR
jgi:hypothetical protein